MRRFIRNHRRLNCLRGIFILVAFLVCTAQYVTMLLVPTLDGFFIVWAIYALTATVGVGLTLPAFDKVPWLNEPLL